MKIWEISRGLGALALVAVVAGCHSLDVQNPNAPASNVLTDPGVIAATAGGTLHSFFNNYMTLEVAGVLDVAAQSSSSSWNNGNINSYQHIAIGPSDTTAPPDQWTRPNGWYNDLASPQRTSVEHWWYGYYSTLSSANDALRSIVVDHAKLPDDNTAAASQAVARLMQGASLMMIALDYDQGYFLDEHTPTSPDSLKALKRVSRKVLRDSALSKLDQAIAFAGANSFTTDAGWANGISYSNTDIEKIANTLAAFTLAYYPRDDQEASTVVDWAKVAQYASQGISKDTAVTFAFIGDGCPTANNWCNDFAYWFTEYSTGRVSTRIAHFMDPATQLDPYALGVGSPQPHSPDKRMGDGSYGAKDIEKVYQNVPKDTGAGTYFAWSANGEIFRPDRGYYAQSNIGMIRYDDSGDMNYSMVPGGYGKMPVIIPSTNDLLWAEALLRSGGDLSLAASLINKTRVGAGGLPPASASDPLGSPSDGPCMANGVLAKDGGPCTLWSKLLYEQEIEYLQLGPVPYWHERDLPVVKAIDWERATGCRTDSDSTQAGNQCTPNLNSIYNGPRYIQGLIPGTPREMPVPAKELALGFESFYTFGGTGAPPKGTEAP